MSSQAYRFDYHFFISVIIMLFYCGSRGLFPEIIIFCCFDTHSSGGKPYKALMWNKRFTRRRNTGVEAFWRQEGASILNGQKPTRNWSAEQIDDIIHSRIPRFEGQAIHGHHTYSASRFPHLANRGEVIYPATRREHHKGWHGGNYRKSKPGKRIRYIEEF